MKTVAALLLVVVAGCVGSTTDAVVERAAQTDPAPFCTFSAARPAAIDGAVSYSKRPAGVDCVPPGGGEVFSLGFASADWWFQLDAPRAAFAVGEPQPITYGAASLLLVLDSGASCWNWTGDFTVMSDLPGWDVYIDATCADDPSLHVVGHWNGTRG